MHYVMWGIVAGFIAGYTIEAFSPFAVTWGVTAIMICIAVGIIMQYRAWKNGTTSAM